MPNPTKLKAKARNALHKRMSVTAFAFNIDTPDYVDTITVRVIDNFVQLGDQKGSNYNFAHIEDNSPKLVFLRSEIAPYRGLIVTLSHEEGYFVEAVLPPHGVTVTANVARVSSSEMENYPYPKGD